MRRARDRAMTRYIAVPGRVGSANADIFFGRWNGVCERAELVIMVDIGYVDVNVVGNGRDEVLLSQARICRGRARAQTPRVPLDNSS